MLKTCIGLSVCESVFQSVPCFSHVHSGLHLVYFKVEAEDDDHVFAEKCAVSTSEENIVLLRRLHSVQPSNHNFKQMIAFVSGNICYIILRLS